MRRLTVWWEGRRVGELTQDDDGELGFAYGAEWLADAAAPALSASLPRRADAFSRRECRPFFGGLLPEERQREAAAQTLGVSAANEFALLDRLGGDVAGALQFLPPGEAPPAAAGPWNPMALGDLGLLRILDALPARPLLAGEEGLRLSLAGAQAKVPVVLVNRKVALPRPGQPTTHILKPAMPRFEGTTENEAFTMRLATAAGLEAAGVEPRVLRTPEGGARTFLLVARYDRAPGPRGRVRRLHQEDFCQALGVPPERKYQGEGGPSLPDAFALLRRVSARPAADALKLLDAVVFNAVAGNADAHGKNFSLLYDEAGPRLAPLYDLLCTVVYPDLSPRFAMKIGGRGRLEDLDPGGWAAFAEKAELALPFVRRRAGALARKISAVAGPVGEALALIPGLDPAWLGRLATLMETRAERCVATLEQTGA
ncbi:MAG: type II toxin-antitoxin system HipA family toxin [Holophagaceae bacterium]|nr:type II toxin-antitoxin system HipA family toxin [Holophagaceae bacterium]